MFPCEQKNRGVRLCAIMNAIEKERFFLSTSFSYLLAGK